ncbi:MAG TPA: flagellar biosynthetic protein FliO [Syntrophorhabdaceae bacterium]|nr:flagellar biosynthetic protein FliO [Syntrophorhabdaceae bacterium]
MIDIYTGIIKVVLVMLGLGAGVILLVRYSGKFKFPALTSQNQGYGLKKAGSLYLGYKKFISVVEVKDYVLVIGGGDKEITLLAKWKNEDKTE